MSVSDVLHMMQVAESNLRLWLEVVGGRETPTIHPDRVKEALAALQGGLIVLGMEPVAEDDEPMYDQDAAIEYIQESLMRNGNAVPAELIKSVLDLDTEYAHSLGLERIDWRPEIDNEE